MCCSIGIRSVPQADLVATLRIQPDGQDSQDAKQDIDWRLLFRKIRSNQVTAELWWDADHRKQESIVQQQVNVVIT